MAYAQIDQRALAAYLAALHGAPVEGLTLEPLGLQAGERQQGNKAYGYGKPVRLTYRVGQDTHHRVLHTTAPGPFGHEHMADRAADWLRAHHAYNLLPGHIHSYDVGALTASGAIRSVGDASEFFLLTSYAQGIPYGEDMNRLGTSEAPERGDLQRCDALCDGLLLIHAEKNNDPGLYRKSLRQLVGHHECIFGLIDSYPADDPVATPDRLQAIETACNHWRWRLRHKTHRLSRVHGDFHPWNLIFDSENKLTTLDRSRGEYGDPADDVISLTINYLHQALLSREAFTGACRALFDRFWQRYLDASGDGEMLGVVAPFLAFRGLVLASPIWYPDTPAPIRDRLLKLIERVLNQDRFDTGRIDEYLTPSN